MRSSRLPRRRFLQIAAAAPLLGMSVTAQASAPIARWRGVALGAQSQIVLSGISDSEAAPIFAQLRDEIARLEAIFSLFQGQSSLSRLNATGELNNPERELLDVLNLSRSVWQASIGAFDPGVQLLWQARSKGKEPDRPRGDFADLRLSEQKATIGKNTALTLNGIAQGFVTDRIAVLLRSQGLKNLVVDAGEQRVLGERPAGGAWRVAVADPSGNMLTQLSLRDRALATSSVEGTLLVGGQGHIIDGRSGISADRWNTISISHESAAVADALSTAACCLSAGETSSMLKQFPGAILEYRG